LSFAVGWEHGQTPDAESADRCERTVLAYRLQANGD